MSGAMTDDPTEAFRRARVAELNAAQAARAELEAKYGRAWSPDEVRADFEVLGFMAPFVVVRRKADGKKGSLEFQHHPRFYFNWQED
jgi:hypothetical protein